MCTPEDADDSLAAPHGRSTAANADDSATVMEADQTSGGIAATRKY